MTPTRSLKTGLVAGAAALAVTTGVLFLLGAGGYRGGFFVVFFPIAIATSAATWIGAGGGSDRATWLAAALVFALSAAAALVGSAPPSKTRLLEQARDLTPDFFEEQDATTRGHSWCRPDCPQATLVLRPPGTGDRAVMLAIGTELLQEGLVTRDELGALSTSREVSVSSEDVRYEVLLDGTGDNRTVRLTLAAR